ERLWAAFERSGEYAFKRSHTTAYGVIAYQTAYRKANWPAEFGAAVLRFTGSGTDKAHLRVATIRSLRGEGIEVMAPDINASDEHTVARPGQVWIGPGETKGVGASAAQLVAARAGGGPVAARAAGATGAGARAPRARAKAPQVRILDMEYSILERAARQGGVSLAVTGTHPTEALARRIADLYRPGPDDDAAPRPPRGLHRLPGEDGARVHTGGVVS